MNRRRNWGKWMDLVSLPLALFYVCPERDKQKYQECKGNVVVNVNEWTRGSGVQNELKRREQKGSGGKGGKDRTMNEWALLGLWPKGERVKSAAAGNSCLLGRPSQICSVGFAPTQKSLFARLSWRKCLVCPPPFLWPSPDSR